MGPAERMYRAELATLISNGLSKQEAALQLGRERPDMVANYVAEKNRRPLPHPHLVGSGAGITDIHSS